jgi:hypothetical protein
LGWFHTVLVLDTGDEDDRVFMEGDVTIKTFTDVEEAETVLRVDDGAEVVLGPDTDTTLTVGTELDDDTCTVLPARGTDDALIVIT